MLHIYHLTNSRSQRIIWLLEELKLNYEVNICRRDQETHTAPHSLTRIHPLGKVPILVDDTNPNDAVTLAETGAIVDYLLDNYGHGQLIPTQGTPEKSLYLYWKNFADGSLMPNLAMKQVFARITAASPWFVRPLFRRIQLEVNRRYLNPTLLDQLNLIEQQLQHSLWIAGDVISAADIMLVFLLEAASISLMQTKPYPAITAYLTRVCGRISYQHAQARGQWSVHEHRAYWQDV